MTLFLGVLLFNIFVYVVIFSANADASFSSIGDSGNLEGRVNATSNEDINSATVTHWYSGFNVSVFDMPWWVNIFYVTLQAVILSLSIYAMIRGLS